MAFESLSDKLQNIFKNLRGKGRLSEADVKAALKEVKMALLEADVSFKVVAICCVIFSDCVSRLFQRSNSRFVLFRTGNLSVRFQYPAGVLLRFCGLSRLGYCPVLFRSVSYRFLLSSVMRSPADTPSVSSVRSDDSS